MAFTGSFTTMTGKTFTCPISFNMTRKDIDTAVAVGTIIAELDWQVVYPGGLHATIGTRMTLHRLDDPYVKEAHRRTITRVRPQIDEILQLNGDDFTATKHGRTIRISKNKNGVIKFSAYNDNYN